MTDDATKTTPMTGKCFCGAVSFELTGDPLMNALCHCRACSIAVGTTTPIHLYAMTHGNYKINGEDKIKVYNQGGTLKIGRCTECSCPIYQGPEKSPFKAFFPRYFDGYVDGTLMNKTKQCNLFCFFELSYELITPHLTLFYLFCFCFPYLNIKNII